MKKGVSSWLSALLIKAIGYALNKQEFTYAVYMRYGWNVKGIPTPCACVESQTPWIIFIASYVNWVATLQWGTTHWEILEAQMESVEMFRPNPHFCQSMRMTMKEKSTLLTMQCWILCKRTVEKLWENFRWHKDHPTYLSHILGSP